MQSEARFRGSSHEGIVAGPSVSAAWNAIRPTLSSTEHAALRSFFSAPPLTDPLIDRRSADDHHNKNKLVVTTQSRHKPKYPQPPAEREWQVADLPVQVVRNELGVDG